jgi:DNA-binding HxlR family transcriptional regulator
MCMMMTNGMLKVLRMSDSQGPKSFGDFLEISVDKRRISSATVSKRLNEFVDVGAIDEVIARSKSGRKIIGYRATEKGKRIIKLSLKLRDELSRPNGHRIVSNAIK